MHYYKGLLFLLSFTVVLLASGADYRKLPLQDKISHPDLTFCVAFDNLSTRADLAKGAPDSTTLSTLNLGLRGTIGFDTAQGYQPVGDEELFYPVSTNLSLESGTLTFWLNAPDYDPGAKEADGKKRGNIAIYECMATNATSYLRFRLYEFGDGVYFDAYTTNSSRGVAAPRNAIKKNQWHQIAMTWDRDQASLAIYLNGELCETTALSLPIIEMMKNTIVDPKGSHFGIPHTVWGVKRTTTIQVDDIKVYSRALSRLEIKKQYHDLLLDSQASTIDLFEMKLKGPGDALDAIEVAMDFAALPEKQAAALKEGKLKMGYRLTGPDGFTKSGKWDLTRSAESRRISGIVKPGTYTLSCAIQEDDKQSDTNEVAAKIIRPDLSFIGNKIGCSDKVPAPWTPLVMQGRGMNVWDWIGKLFRQGRTVNVWNRVYEFNQGPFPENIAVAGKNLLLKPPELKIALPSGPAKIKYSAGKATCTEREATLTGRGAFYKYYFDYTTLVTYDGMIKATFVMHGSPTISSMTLEWQVNPASAQYLMTPCLNENTNDQFAAAFPKTHRDPTQLWFTSEKNGGFAYAMEHDANWSYPEDYPVLAANKKTGECKVTLIAKEASLPETTDYQALFIATPTRPLVAERRNLRFGPEDVNQPYKYAPGTPARNDGRPLLCGSRGLDEGISSFKPIPGLFEKAVKPYQQYGVYGMADSLTDLCPLANYFTEYYDIPGAYKYTFPSQVYNQDTKKYEVKTSFSVPACNAAMGVNDYLLHNIQEIIDNPAGKKLWMVYYDLAGNNLCGNKLHGCGFTDKLGRNIKTFTFMKKRALFERSVQLAHDNGKIVMLHAQRDFNPFMHGLADYWYPGEQHNALTLKNPHCYTEDISDAIWRSEYNSQVLGVSVVFLPATLFPPGTDKAKKEKVYEEMMSQCLLYDIECSLGDTPGPLITKVWFITEKYGVDSKTLFHRYYEQDKARSSNEAVQISYYELPGNKYLIILANKTAQDAETEVDLARLNIADGSVMREEFKGNDVTVKNGKVKLTIPSRTCRLLGYPAK